MDNATRCAPHLDRGRHRDADDPDAAVRHAGLRTRSRAVIRGDARLPAGRGPEPQPDRQAHRGRRHLHRAHRERVQPVAKPVERPRGHVAARQRLGHRARHRLPVAHLAAGRLRPLRRGRAARAGPWWRAATTCAGSSSRRCSSVAFFVLPTRVHERYLFPALALAAPLVLSGRMWPWIYGALLSRVLRERLLGLHRGLVLHRAGSSIPAPSGSRCHRIELLTSTLLTDWGSGCSRC